MSEFTGERVVPGLVDEDLFNEHIARYRFASKVTAKLEFAPTILDAGCGTGYGSTCFQRSARVTAIDVSPEALRHARENFGAVGVCYAQANCESLPFADGSFDLVCAFEVIEHLERWDAFLTEARRVLKPAGLLLVSTPNKAYYAEARAQAGPNPFHVHEFEYAEFDRELKAVFPHVRMWSQNHAASIVFAPAEASGSEIEASGEPDPEHAHFFLAICGRNEFSFSGLYAWLPDSGNVLRERERHISKLQSEMTEKNAWLEQRAAEHAKLQAAHVQTLLELRERNEWASALDARLRDAGQRIVELQSETEERLEWVKDLELRVETGQREIERLNVHREELERDLAERAAWAFELDAQVQSLRTSLQELTGHVDDLHRERELIARSKWMRFGRALKLGPRVE